MESFIDAEFLFSDFKSLKIIFSWITEPIIRPV